MKEVLERCKCCGCGSCFSACPQKAITMKWGKDFFKYPEIDESKCVNCGVCQKVCPVIQYEKKQQERDYHSNIQKGFAARSKNYKQRLESSSGGIFPIIAEFILNQSGIVVGAAFDENFNVTHSIVEKKDDLVKLQGSKYLQSEIDLNIFREIKEYLQQGRKVLFSGLACQVEGLKAFLRKDYSNLFTIDLICMGIPSPQIWQIYLKTYFPNEIIKHVNFKEKSVGWNHFNLMIETDKQCFKQWGMKNPYFKSMFNAYNMRESCFQCPFKKEKRFADITIADCWGASQCVPEIDDNKGLSSVIIHSQKGEELWRKIDDNLDFKQIPLDLIIRGNSNMIKNCTCNKKKRTIFFFILKYISSRIAFIFAKFSVLRIF